MSVDQILSVESGGNPNARNPRSSAAGLGQFIDSTWMDMVSRYRPDLTTGMSREQILGLKMDPALSREMTAKYAEENGAKLEAAGMPVRPGTQYLAHFAGPDGATKVLGADPSMPVGQLLGPKVVAANPFLAKMTAGDLVGWADKKMGGAPQPAQMPPQAVPQPPMIGGAPAPQNAPAPAAVPNTANMAPAPVPEPAQAAPAQPQADPFAGAEKEHFAAIKAPMLSAPQRPKADFSRLRMMLAQR
jgi:hypothetical protein